MYDKSIENCIGTLIPINNIAALELENITKLEPFGSD